MSFVYTAAAGHHRLRRDGHHIRNTNTMAIIRTQYRRLRHAGITRHEARDLIGLLLAAGTSATWQHHDGRTPHAA